MKSWSDFFWKMAGTLRWRLAKDGDAWKEKWIQSANSTNIRIQAI